jgi:ankyrin repeat protein
MKFTYVLFTVVFLLMNISLQGQTIFVTAAENDPVKTAELIKDDPSVINLKNEAGNYAMHYAAIHGSVEIMELLLSHGAEINCVNMQMNTPLHEAVISGKINTAEWLIKKGAKLNKKNVQEQTPLHLAATRNQQEIAGMLVSAGAEIDPRDSYMRTPFLYAARQNGNVNIGKLLLERGADINVRDKYSDMPLNLAAWRGFKDFINFLLDNKAEFDTSDGKIRQTLHFAAGCGMLRLFSKVIEMDDNLFASEDRNDRTMRIAIAGGSTEIVSILEDKGIPVKHNTNVYGWTPVHYAANNGHSQMVEFLAAKGADLTKRTLSGKTPYNLAELSNHTDVMDAIKKLRGDTSAVRFPDLKGPYMGQPLTFSGAEIFSPDIVSHADEDGNHSSVAISPDLTEIYWFYKHKIFVSKMVNGKWSEPVVASVSSDNTGEYTDDVPFITPDGLRLFFTSTRPVDAAGLKKENIWYADRIAGGWSEPYFVSPEVNALNLHWSISVSDSGTLYFGGTGEGGYGRGDIYYSRLVDGVYTKPENMGPVINSKDLDHCPYIAPDESYILFARMSFTEGQCIYISFRGKTGEWLTPVRTPVDALCPYISPDGKYLFFLGNGIQWIPAKFIEELRPKEVIGTQ